MSLTFEKQSNANEFSLVPILYQENHNQIQESPHCPTEDLQQSRTLISYFRDQGVVGMLTLSVTLILIGILMLAISSAQAMSITGLICLLIGITLPFILLVCFYIYRCCRKCC
jgi:hypothetical protein